MPDWINPVSNNVQLLRMLKEVIDMIENNAIKSPEDVFTNVSKDEQSKVVGGGDHRLHFAPVGVYPADN